MRRLLDDFGDRKDVLDALSGNMMTFIWSGSLVPYFEQYAAPLRTLLDHHRPSVAASARRSSLTLSSGLYATNGPKTMSSSSAFFEVTVVGAFGVKERVVVVPYHMPVASIDPRRLRCRDRSTLST